MAAIIKPLDSAKVEISGTAMLQIAGFVPEKGKPYQLLGKDREAFAAFTEAAFHLAGLVSRSSEKAAPIAMDGAKHGGLAAWRAIVGSTAYGHWAKSGRIDPQTGRVTVAGLNELSSRTSGTSRGYNTSVAKVREVAEAIRTGGTLQVKGSPLKFAATIKVARKAPAKAARKPKATAKPKAVRTITPKAK